MSIRRMPEFNGSSSEHCAPIMRLYPVPPTSAPFRRPARPVAEPLDFGRALRCGMLAGGVMLLLLIGLAVTVYDEAPWKLPRMVAAVVLGPGVLEPSQEFDARAVATGVFLYAVFSMLYGVALASLVVGLRRRLAPLVGIAVGAALYVLHFHLFTLPCPWLAELRSADTLAAHLVFGLLAARAYCDGSSGRGC